jgi:hypothetical protein
VSYWVVVSVLAALGVYWLVSAIVQVWRERHKRPWWRDTEDDYIDLRPRIQTGRRKWR